MLAERAPLGPNSAGFQCGQPAWLVVVGWVAITWYSIVTLVCWIGYVQLQRHYSKAPQKAISTTALPHTDIPHVTIIRPVKGIEPFLYDCLAASIRQDYPRDKLTIYFCVSSIQDPAYTIVMRVLQDFPDADARVFIEPPYEYTELGPNPKIRNMSRAYREAKGDIVWIMDCNIWLSKGVCGRMVDRLCGLNPKINGGQKFKFVHHLPIVVDVPLHCPDEKSAVSSGQPMGNTNSRDKDFSTAGSLLSRAGGRLEELFLASSHPKMYAAINTVLIAPCIIGKSAMFRRSHLNYITSTPPKHAKRVNRRPGIDYFSDNICEDHLIGDRLWNARVFQEAELHEKWGKHDLAFGDMAIQPMSGMSVASYFDRRVRWLRVRKFTVLLATLVEPGTESFLCSLYLAFGLTTSIPARYPEYCSYLGNWSAFVSIWFVSILVWMVTDWTVYLRLHSGVTVEVDEHTPSFARPLPKSWFARRPFRDWLFAWLGREALAFPIWIWSFYGGTTVIWRDKVFKVGLDAVTYEIGQATGQAKKAQEKSLTIRQALDEGRGGAASSDVRRRTPKESFIRNMVTARFTEPELSAS